MPPAPGVVADPVILQRLSHLTLQYELPCLEEENHI